MERKYRYREETGQGLSRGTVTLQKTAASDKQLFKVSMLNYMVSCISEYVATSQFNFPQGKYFAFFTHGDFISEIDL